MSNTKQAKTFLLFLPTDNILSNKLLIEKLLCPENRALTSEFIPYGPYLNKIIIIKKKKQQPKTTQKQQNKPKQTKPNNLHFIIL